MRDPELLPFGLRDDRSVVSADRGAQPDRHPGDARDDDGRRALRGRAGPAHAAPPDRAPRGRGRRRALASTTCARRSARPRRCRSRCAPSRKPGDVIAVESPAYFGVLQTDRGPRPARARDPGEPAHRARRLGVRGDAARPADPRAVVVTPTVSNPLGSIMPDDERERLVGSRAATTSRSSRTTSTASSCSTARGRGRCARSRARARTATSCSSARCPRRSRRATASAGSPAAAGTIRSCGSSTASRSRARRCPAWRSPSSSRRGGYDRHLRRLRAAVAGNVERYRETIATQFPEGTRVSAPRGGFVLWVELPPGVDALAAPRAGAAPPDRRRARAAVLGAPAVRELHPDLGGDAVVGADRRGHAHARPADRAGIARAGCRDHIARPPSTSIVRPLK